MGKILISLEMYKWVQFNVISWKNLKHTVSFIVLSLGVQNLIKGGLEINFVCEECLDVISSVLLLILTPLKLLSLYFDHLRKLLSEEIQILSTLAEYRGNIDWGEIKVSIQN